MMNSVLAGRLYNGKAHEWLANKGKENEEERTLFRGRINYRDPEGREYHWIDAVCFKDFGANGGLVTWLEDNYSVENSGSENGGDAIIVTGFVRPTTKRKTVEIKGKKNGKTVKKEIPNVPYESFEFVIQTATFPPSSQSTGNKKEDVEVEDDFDDLDDFEVIDGEEDEVDEIEEDEIEEEEEAPKPKKRTARKTTADKKKKTTTRSKKTVREEPADDDFFDE